MFKRVNLPGTHSESVLIFLTCVVVGSINGGALKPLADNLGGE